MFGDIHIRFCQRLQQFRLLALSLDHLFCHPFRFQHFFDECLERHNHLRLQHIRPPLIIRDRIHRPLGQVADEFFALVMPHHHLLRDVNDEHVVSGIMEKHRRRQHAASPALRALGDV